MLIEGAVKRKVSTLVVILFLTSLGIYSAFTIPRFTYPPLDFPEVHVKAKMPSVTPQRMESQVTRRLEESIGTLPDLRKMVSETSEGETALRLQFNWGTSMGQALLDVYQKIDEIRTELPPSLSELTVTHENPYKKPFLIVHYEVPNEMDRVALTEQLKKRVVHKLPRLEGVAGAELRGGSEQEIRVSLFSSHLAAHGVPLFDVVNRIKAAAYRGSAGTVSQGQYDVGLRVESSLESKEDIENLPIKTAPLRIRDFGEVSVWEKKKTGPLVLTVYKDTKSSVQKTRERVAHVLKPWPQFQIIFDEAALFKEKETLLFSSLIFGGVLCFGVIWAFMKTKKEMVILGFVFPVVFFVTVLFMKATGLSFNLFSLAGLALGGGTLLDASLVVIENIHRRQAAVAGTVEVAGAVIMSGLTTVVVFLPFPLLPEAIGALFKEFFFSIALSQGVSIAVALTLIPLFYDKFLHFHTRA